MLKKIILLAAVLGLSACAFDKDESKVNAKEAADRAKIESIYKPIEGVYRGTLTTDTVKQPVELRLFILEVQSGQNANGEDRYLKVLRANLKQTNSTDPSSNFKARYIQETGELILSNSSTSFMDNEAHTINAKVIGEKIVGDAVTIAGQVGQIELSLTSKSSNRPDNSDGEFKERLRRQYQAIVGTYVGENILEGKATFTGTLTLSIVEKEIGPYLVGQFKRNDDPLNDMMMILTSTYEPQYSPARLTMTGKLSHTNINYEANFQGVFIDGNYHGSWRSSTRGFQGDFILKKVK